MQRHINSWGDFGGNLREATIFFDFTREQAASKKRNLFQREIFGLLEDG
jgi:hypothetical protein